ncbi:MAG TPA: MFS transporter, partial [Nocardioidaceae bacterium]|nr:MFS transporter [Nocardioidaceae bacterium]
IRSRLEETPEFAALVHGGRVARNPLLETLRDHWPAVIRTAGYALFQNAALYVILTFVPSYQSATLGHSSVLASTSSVVSMTVVCALIPVFGALSDRWGRRPVLGLSCVAAIVGSYPLFVLMGAEAPALVVVAHVGLGVILAIFLGPTLTAMNEMFTTRVRYGGFSLGYNISVSAFGGTAPFIVTWAINASGNDNAPALYVIAAAIITGVVILTAKETAPTQVRTRSRS